jgi:hypothetical protein
MAHDITFLINIYIKMLLNCLSLSAVNLKIAVQNSVTTVQKLLQNKTNMVAALHKVKVEFMGRWKISFF